MSGTGYARQDASHLIDSRLRKSLLLDKLLSCGLLEIACSFEMESGGRFKAGHQVTLLYTLSETERAAERRRGGGASIAYIKSDGIVTKEELKSYDPETGIPGVTWKIQMNDPKTFVAFDEHDTVESAVLYIQAVYL